MHLGSPSRQVPAFPSSDVSSAIGVGSVVLGNAAERLAAFLPDADEVAVVETKTGPPPKHT